MRKIVRFYELRCIRKEHGVEKLVEVKGDFWAGLEKKVKGLEYEARKVPTRGRWLYGEHRLAVSPARKHFYIGGVRNRSEWPDSLNGETGLVADLKTVDRNADLIEPTFVVPFGRSNQVAVLSMSFSSPRVSALETWVTGVAGETKGIEGYSLVPVINKLVAQRLEEASGAMAFRVKMLPDVDIPENGGGIIGQAARVAKQVSVDTTIELGWSLGNRHGNPETKAEMLGAARWVRSDWVKQAKVTLEMPDGDGFTREKYDLIEEQFTSAQNFDIPRDAPPSELSVFTGIDEAIESFRREFS
jgi:hypothetical protein